MMVQVTLVIIVSYDIIHENLNLIDTPTFVCLHIQVRNIMEKRTSSVMKSWRIHNKIKIGKI